MNIALKVVAGPLKDKVFPLTKPLTIGRQGDITLEDPMVSGVHARLENDPARGWILYDNDSKNGVRVGERKVKSVSLKPGMTFHIGDHAFLVMAEDEGTVVRPQPKPTAHADVPMAAPAPKPKKRQKYWYEALASFLKTNKDAFKDSTRPLAPLEPAVILEFVRGVQMNSKWILGYGPRKLGAASIDLPIWEPGAPEICFEIQPTADGILFRTEHPDMVLLNNEAVDSRLLHVGDTIAIHETLIEVDFTE